MVTNMRLENNGLVVPITQTEADKILAATGRQGFGIAPTQLIIREGAGEGGRYRQTKRGVRDIDYPIFFQATQPGAAGARDVYEQMRQMVAIFNDRKTPARLYVTNADGQEVYLDLHYGGGGDHQYGTDTNGLSWARWAVTLRAPRPYWISTDSRNYALRTGNAGRGLIKNTSLVFLQLTSSGAIGTIQVNNPGDVPADVIWQIKGPGNSLSADVNGVGFVYNAPITNDNPITIDTFKKTVVDSLGINRYADLGPAPKLFQIPAGRSSVNIEMGGADSTTEILFNFQPQYEVVF